jgi:hypothetical protein
MKILAQKSLKTELRLKRYDILKFQGLGFNYNSKIGARSGLITKTGALV